MITDFSRCIALTAILAMTGTGCHTPGNSSKAANAPDNTNESANERDSKRGPGARDGESAPDDAGFALIVDVEKDVQIKLKGAQEFKPIVRWPFFSGDTLQVGIGSKAFVKCKDLCELITGTYTACCTPECKVKVPFGRRDGTDIGAPQPMMSINDLRPEEVAAIADSESKLQQLGLGKTTTQFLKANLYSSWRLKEAERELDLLSLELRGSEAREELGNIYAPVTRKTGDFLVLVSLQDKAVIQYKKAIQLGPQTADTEPNYLREKATAHVRLAEVYAAKGNRAEAVENLVQAKKIYVNQGDTVKAAALDRTIAATTALDR